MERKSQRGCTQGEYFSTEHKTNKYFYPCVQGAAKKAVADAQVERRKNKKLSREARRQAKKQSAKDKRAKLLPDSASVASSTAKELHWVLLMLMYSARRARMPDFS